MSVSKKCFKYSLLLSLAMICLLNITTWGQGNVYYVAEYGSDNNLGTEARPWQSVDKAAETMVAGDTLYVKEGTYSGFMVSRSGTADNYISYLAYQGDTPIINGEIWFDNGASYNKIDGFILEVLLAVELK